MMTRDLKFFFLPNNDKAVHVYDMYVHVNIITVQNISQNVGAHVDETLSLYGR